MKEQSKPALDLLEEAAHVLRNAPPSAFAAYLAGSVPFILFFLYYWADMSSAAAASTNLLDFSLVLTLLYIWMKAWHSIFALLIRNHLHGDSNDSITFARWMRIAMIQSIVQPSALFLLMPAFIVLFPFGWIYAFYRNVTILGNGDSSDVKEVVRQSWRFATLWPFQNHKMLSILSLFSIIVFLNVCILIFSIPSLIQTFFGIESMFTRSGFHILNTTFLMTALGISYLCLNPFSIVLYTLRCFYAEAQSSGEDLRIELAATSAAYE